MKDNNVEIYLKYVLIIIVLNKLKYNTAELYFNLTLLCIIK
jgi:hypothetical protein